MTKRISFLVVVFLLCILTKARAFVEVDGVVYILSEEDNSALVYWSDPEVENPLERVNIPSTLMFEGDSYTVTEIAPYAFAGYKSLKEVVLPESVQSICKGVFADCVSLTKINLPNSLEVIEDSLFFNCESLEEIKIPESVNLIRSLAFYGCNSLTNIKLPNNVELEYHAFLACEELERIEVLEDNQLFSSENGVLLDKDKEALLLCPNGKSGVYFIPKGIKTICKGSFWGCDSLTYIKIPDGVTEIESYSFGLCTGLTSLTIPNSVKEIGDYSFCDCSSLMCIFSMRTTPPVIAEHTFSGVDKSVPIYVPDESVSAYKEAEGWCEFENIQSFPFEISSSVESIYTDPSYLCSLIMQKGIDPKMIIFYLVGGIFLFVLLIIGISALIVYLSGKKGVKLQHSIQKEVVIDLKNKKSEG